MPIALVDTSLFRELETRCSEKRHVAPISGPELLAMVTSSTREMGNLLNQACRAFEDYTLHDEHHAARVVWLMGLLLGDELSRRLNAIEIALLILAAYGHDTGMSAGRQLRDELIQSPEYERFLFENETRWLEVEQAVERKDLDTAEFLKGQLFQDFLRTSHHRRSAELMRTTFGEYLVVEGKSLAEPVAQLC